MRIAGVEIYGSHLELRNLQTAWHVRPGRERGDAQEHHG